MGALGMLPLDPSVLARPTPAKVFAGPHRAASLAVFRSSTHVPPKQLCTPSRITPATLHYDDTHHTHHKSIITACPNCNACPPACLLIDAPDSRPDPAALVCCCKGDTPSNSSASFHDR